MKDRTFPLWLLRDVAALIGVVLSFWPLVIMVIANGRRAMRGRKVSPAVYEHLMLMLPLAEARLRHALYRQAFRAFGWNVRHVPREQLPPVACWEDFAPRFEAYRLAIMDLRAASRTFTDRLRQHYRIRASVDANTVRAAHAPAFAALRRDESTGITHGAETRPSTCRAEAQRRREHERGLTTARGPPTFLQFPIAHAPHLSAPARLRPPLFVRIRT